MTMPNINKDAIREFVNAVCRGEERMVRAHIAVISTKSGIVLHVAGSEEDLAAKVLDYCNEYYRHELRDEAIVAYERAEDEDKPGIYFNMDNGCEDSLELMEECFIPREFEGPEI